MAAPNIVSSAMFSPYHLAVVTATLSPASVGAATTAEQTFTITGLSVGDSINAADRIINVVKPTHQAGLAVGNARVTAANTVGIVFINATAGAIVPTASEVYQLTVWRPYTTANSDATVV